MICYISCDRRTMCALLCVTNLSYTFIFAYLFSFQTRFIVVKQSRIRKEISWSAIRSVRVVIQLIAQLTSSLLIMRSMARKRCWCRAEPLNNLGAVHQPSTWRPPVGDNFKIMSQKLCDYSCSKLLLPWTTLTQR